MCASDYGTRKILNMSLRTVRFSLAKRKNIDIIHVKRFQVTPTVR